MRLVAHVYVMNDPASNTIDFLALYIFFIFKQLQLLSLYRLTFTHPPRTNKATLMDGLTSDVAFVKANMQDKLKDKVRRNNNLVVEIQGAVTITKK